MGRRVGGRWRTGTTAVLLGLVLPASVGAQEGGLPTPLFSEEGSPVQRLGLTPMTEGADPVGEGRIRADLWLGYSNIWENDSTATHHLYLDMERLVTALTVRYGVSDRLELGGRASLETTWGGFLDPVVQGLHEFLGLGTRFREEYPEGEYRQFLEVEGKRLLEVDRTRLALEDVRIFGKWLLHRSPDGGRALALRGVVRVPIRKNRIGAERSDAGLMLLGRTRWWRLHLHGMLGGSTVRRAPELRPVLNPAQAFLMAAAEYPFNPSFSGILQFTASSQLLRDIGDRDVDGLPTNTILGLAWRPSPEWRIEFALQEDTPPWGPSLDFTLQLGVSRGG